MSAYGWQFKYDAAKSEQRLSLIDERIALAERAILDRVEDDIQGRCVLDAKERADINIALKFLRRLKRACAA